MRAEEKRALSGVGLIEKNVPTNIAIVHEPGHPEPWIIAMDEAPTPDKALDYRLALGHRSHV